MCISLSLSLYTYIYIYMYTIYIYIYTFMCFFYLFSFIGMSLYRCETATQHAMGSINRLEDRHNNRYKENDQHT